MKIIRVKVNDLRLAEAEYNTVPTEAYKHAPIIVQHNAPQSYMQINPASIGNALFVVFYGEKHTDFFYARAGSIIPLPPGKEVRVCIAQSNYPRQWRAGIAAVTELGNASNAGGGVNILWDRDAEVEFFLLSHQETHAYVTGKLGVGDIVCSREYNGPIYDAAWGDRLSILGADIMPALSWTALSLRIRLTGGWVRDAYEPAWLFVNHARLTPPGIDVFGIDVFPFPGIGEAYIQIPLVGFGGSSGTGSNPVVGLIYYDGVAHPFDESAGIPGMFIEVVKGNLNPGWCYWCDRYITEATSGASWPFHYRQIGAEQDPTGIIIDNQSVGGTWRVNETGWIFMNDFSDNVEYPSGAPPSFTDTAASTFAEFDLIDARRHYVTNYGLFTAAPTTPKVVWSCHPRPVGF